LLAGFSLGEIRTEVENRCRDRAFLLKRPRVPYRRGNDARENLRLVIALDGSLSKLVEFREIEPADLALFDPEVVARDRPDLRPG
jgi:hypothetical protein